MGFKYRIMTDSSADMLPEFAAAEEIGIIPMSYTIGEEQFNCDHVETDEERRRFYQAQRDGKDTHTAQVNLQDCIDRFSALAATGESILFLSLSGGLSGSYNTSRMAADLVMEDYPDVEIRCVDSSAATGGLGMLLELAAMKRSEGLSVSENAAWLEENKLRIQHWFMVDDLMFLRKGGRLSATSAVLGTALSIKPILKIEADGTLNNFARKRSAKLAMLSLLQHYQESSLKEEGEILYVVHSDNDAAAEFLEAELKKINPSCKIRRVQLTPVIGAHTGPGMCAVVNLSPPELARK